MKEIAIIAAARTPIANFGGAFKDLTGADLGVIVVKEVIRRSGLKPADIDQVIFCKARQAGVGPNIARQILYRSGIPCEKIAYTVNMACASSIQSLILACYAIRNSDAEIIIAGGTESMSKVPYMLDRVRFDGYRLGHATLIDGMYKDGFLDPLSGLIMGQTAENLVEMYNISREEQDKFALLSNQRAIKAIKEGRFKDEIVPVEVPSKKGEPTIISIDEHPRETTLEKLAQLPPVFKENGTVTAGNSSAITDAAAAVLLSSLDKCKELGIEPMAIVGSWSVVGVEPHIMGIGPIPATRSLLKKSNKKLEDFQLMEFNEAFAAQYLAVEKELNLNREIVNVNGGAIALGHPIACTGARIITTLIYEMIKRDAKLGLASLCVSGGMGASIYFSR